MPDYPPPLDRLLDREIKTFSEKWPDYVAEYALGPEHVPDLIRMAGDPELYESETASYSATIHARRALGQLRAVEAVAPLLAAMDEHLDFDDFWTEELAGIFGRIGPGAIPAIARRLEESKPEQSTRIACASALKSIGEAHPESRDECVAVLTRQLAKKEDDEDSWALNGFLVSSLCDLKAAESAGVIEAAYAADVVDESVTGGWPSAKFLLGIGPEPKGRRVRPRWRIRIDPRIFETAPRRPDLAKLKKRVKGQKKNRKRGR